MRARHESLLSEVLPPEERVIEAVVARYQRVAPAVTRFARSLAENDELQIRLGSQESASEGEIVLDPGVFQAAYARKAPVTPAEVALASALHEVVHLVATDFEERRPIPDEWLPDAAASAAPEMSDTMGFVEDAPGEVELLDEPAAEALRDAPEFTVLEALVKTGGPAAEAMFLSIEDARQEQSLFSSYEGARSVLADLYRSSVPQALGEARPLGQFALSCFLLIGEYEARDRIERHVEPHVALAVNDAAPFLAAVQEASDSWEVAGLALQLLQLARLHNLVTDAEPKETPSTRRLKMEVDREAIAQGVDALRLLTPPLQDQESYDQTRAAAQMAAAEEGRHGAADEAGDPATDQIVLVSQSPTVYLPTGQGGKLVAVDLPDRFRSFAPQGRNALQKASDVWGVAQRRVTGELFPLFAANQRRGLRSGYDAGDLSPFAALFLGAGLYERMFERRDLPSRRSYSVSLLVDGSASMLQPKVVAGAKGAWALAAATLGAWRLARLCEELQIEFEVALFNRSFPAQVDDSERSFVERSRRATGALRRTQGGGATRLTRTVNHYFVKTFDQRWRAREDVLAGLFWTAAEPARAAATARQDTDASPPVSMFERAANVDEFNVAYAAQRLAARNASTRILVVLADGMTRGSVESLAASVAFAEAAGNLVLGIGIGDPTVEVAYSRHQVVSRPADLTDAMINGVRSALIRTIARSGDTWWAHSGEAVLAHEPRSRHA
jgi:hypothetical protein